MTWNPWSLWRRRRTDWCVSFGLFFDWKYPIVPNWGFPERLKFHAFLEFMIGFPPVSNKTVLSRRKSSSLASRMCSSSRSRLISNVYRSIDCNDRIHKLNTGRYTFPGALSTRRRRHISYCSPPENLPCISSMDDYLYRNRSMFLFYFLSTQIPYKF